MNKRTTAAMNVLVAGGKFTARMERDYRGHMKSVTRLYTAANEVVFGIGGATRNVLTTLGVLASEVSCAGTVENWWLAVPSDAVRAVRYDEVMASF